MTYMYILVTYSHNCNITQLSWFYYTYDHSSQQPLRCMPVGISTGNTVIVVLALPSLNVKDCFLVFHANAQIVHVYLPHYRECFPKYWSWFVVESSDEISWVFALFLTRAYKTFELFSFT